MSEIRRLHMHMLRHPNTGIPMTQVLRSIVGMVYRGDHKKHRDDIVDVMTDGLDNRFYYLGGHGGDTKRFLCSNFFLVKTQSQWLFSQTEMVIQYTDDLGYIVIGVTFPFDAIPEPEEEDLRGLDRIDKGGFTFFLDSQSDENAERTYLDRYKHQDIV